MKRKLFKGVLVYAVCASMAFATVPILAEGNSTTVGKNTGSAVKEEIVPVGWSTIDAAYLATINNKILDISSLDTSTGNKSIEIPSSVSNITIKGNTSKIYSGLSIVVQTRTTPLNLTIQDLKMSVSGNGIDVTRNTSITTLIIEGENSIVSTGANGIAVYTGNTLEIDAPTNSETLTIQAGNSSAGIGGSNYNTIKQGNGKIVIKGGTINVRGGNLAAGIGAGESASTEQQDIIIEDGIINAQGGSGGAGIGTAYMKAADATNIIIEGGTVKAQGGDRGAGIGGGSQDNGGKGFKVLIKGGEVEARGRLGGAGIGAGAQGAVESVTITGGIIKAYGSDDGASKGGAGIGGGSERGCSLIVIGEETPVDNNPFIQEAIGGLGAAGIGTGCEGNGNEVIKLLDGIIGLAQGSGGAAGIGGGLSRGFQEIYIKNTQVQHAYGSGGAAGIGTGKEGSHGTNKITIESELYVGAANYNGSIISALGGGYNRDTGHSKVTLKSEVFMSNNKIGELDVTNSIPNLKVYAFECYKEDGVTKIGTGLDFSIRSNSDPSLKLHPDNYSNGTIYGYLKDIGSQKLGVATDYYMEIVDAATGKTYYAEEFARDTSDPNLTIIKMKFVEKKFAAAIVNAMTLNGSKIIPFSTTNIDFVTKLEEDTSVTKPLLDEFLRGQAEIDFNKAATDITPFDLSRAESIRFMVYKRDGLETDTVTPKYTYDSTLTNELNNSISTNIILDNVNKKMIIKYPAGLLNYGEYKIRILLPNTLTKDVNKYIVENVETAVVAEQNKKLTATITYGIKTYITIDGRNVAKEQTGSSNIDVDARYYYLTKIN